MFEKGHLLNPLKTTKNKVLWFSGKEIQKFKAVGIFSISFFVTEIWHFFVFQFFYQCEDFWITILLFFYSAKQCKAGTPMNSALFEFCWYLLALLRYTRFNFHFVNSAPHSVLKLWSTKKVFCTNNFLFLKIILNCFFLQKAETHR